MDGGEDDDMTTAMHEDLLPSIKDWLCLLLAMLVQFDIHAYFIILSFLYISSLGCNSISFSMAGDGKTHHRLGVMRLWDGYRARSVTMRCIPQLLIFILPLGLTQHRLGQEPRFLMTLLFLLGFFVSLV
jgi:hypothetical protein